MNPEFQRNLWLELSPNRLIFMPVVLGLFFLAAVLISPIDLQWTALSGTAEVIFFIVAILWGTRSAAAAIPEEIRERTWDFQRLSALAPWTMVWGKLFGATAYQWYGASICLAAIWAAHTFGGVGEGRLILVVLAAMVMTALAGQAISLLASLIGLRRGYATSRFEVFAYQLIGLIAAVVLDSAWGAVGLGDSLAFGLGSAEIRDVIWFGHTYVSADFVFISVLVGIVWALIGCHQMMRSALRVQNGPLIWSAFVTFVMVYAAGFISGDQSIFEWWDNQRILLVFAIAVAFTYVMAVIEPKEIVEFRWLRTQLSEGKYFRVFRRLPSWALSLLFAAQALLALTIIGHEAIWDMASAEVNLVALFGFLVRDVGIFMFFASGNRAMRGDFGALVTLVILYGVLPIIFGQIISDDAIALFVPMTDELTLMSIVSAFLQAGVVWFLTARQFSAQISGNPS